MATNRTTIPCSPAQLWAVLADGYSYGDWVVGTSHIRAVDGAWPAKGTVLHYTIGRGPIRHDGHTEVVDVTEPDASGNAYLELEAHAWPLGSATIALSLRPTDERCEVTIVEHPKRGLGRRLHNPAIDAFIKVRNVETLRRLGRLAAQR